MTDWRCALTLSERGDIVERGVEDTAESLFAVETDMRGKDDIVATEEIVILLQLSRFCGVAIFVTLHALILFLDRLFTFEDIEPGTREDMLVECFDDRPIVHDATAGGVDEETSFFQ